MNRFEIIKQQVTHVKRFNLYGNKIQFKIKRNNASEEPLESFKEGLKDVVKYVSDSVQENDLIGFTFCGEMFKEFGSGWMNFKPAKDVKFNDIWDLLGSIFQSNTESVNTDTFCLAATSVRLPSGQGNHNRSLFNNYAEECAKRQGIVVIKNKDNLCLVRALVVAKADADKDLNYKKLCQNIHKLQDEFVKLLLQASKIEIPARGGGIEELKKFQEYFTDYKITVYKYNPRKPEILFEGAIEGSKKINLLFHDDHYNVIKSLTAVFSSGYFCSDCKVPYQNKNKHKCTKQCSACRQNSVCDFAAYINCNECNRRFRSQICFDKHKASTAKQKSTCSEIKRCNDCLKNYHGGRVHVCGEYFCKKCNKFGLSNHLCYIQKNNKTSNTGKMLYIFYDLETQQENLLSVGDNKLLHETNLCVFEQRCCKCLENDINFCEYCGVRIHIIKKNNCIQNFFEYVLNIRKAYKQVIIIAHNGSGFDHQFVLNYAITKTQIVPELIMRGSKIIMMKLFNVKFLDSMNYFPMALSMLPKAFDLPAEFKKGYFPHLFNTKENENYVGALPDVKFYSPDTMKENERANFLKWYQEHQHEEFNMQRDIVDYCISDVKILTLACLKFRKMMLEETNVCPFSEATTIASACNLVFRRNFIKEDQIGLIPERGYRNVDPQSRIAMQWLIKQEKELKIKISHAGNGREIKIAGLKVDGFCSQTNQIFEFNGCYYHGHTKCLPYRRDEPINDNILDTLNTRYESTTIKIERLQACGHKVIVQWECDFRKELELNKKMKEELDTDSVLNTLPLNPRDSFFGGRTGNTRTYYKCKEGEKIKYIDVCSLYPYICKYGKFPLKHPEVIVGDENCKKEDLKLIHGLIKCTILPPQDLYHPVLPVKSHNKLMFILCNSCGKSLQQETCHHKEEERCLTGTWVIEEVVKAVEMGYVLKEIHEIWKYNVIQYNKNNNEEGLFTAMMNKFIKIKQQASGWPSNCETESEKENYISKYLEVENIKLDPESIEKNAGLRSLAKLMLNSFWGKFGQRENMPKTSIINDPAEFFEMLTNPHKIVNHIEIINENNVIVCWENKHENVDSLSTVNVVIACFVTAQARLKLYSYMQLLGERVLYYDTDSLIFISKDGHYEPPTGDCLGDMTDELECFGVGSYITEFVSGGPKNYAYKVFSTNTKTEEAVCKVKGIRITYETNKLINFDAIRNLILNNDDQEDRILVKSNSILRTKNHEVVTVPTEKTYRICAVKRKFMENHDSVPYGYIKKNK